MMARNGPPAYAWDWYSRQRLLWRETRSRLAHHASDTARRYATTEAKSDVLALLKADWARDDVVRQTILAVVSEYVFLDRTDVPFARHGHRNPPRGLRWWWTMLTGEEIGAAAPPAVAGAAQLQLGLDEVHEG
ncbi:MAG TPA: hypothetical protein VGA69_04140, partial [Nitriliruptorales bacterium]